MAFKILEQGGWYDSGNTVDPDGTDYVAGQPAKLTSTGWKLALDPEDVLGFFKSDMRDAIAGGPQAVDATVSGFESSAVVMGFNKVVMSPGKLQNGTARTAFLYGTETHTWAVGVRLFLTAAGRWDNAPAAANDPPFGIVMKAPTSATDTLEAVMWSSGPFYSAITT